MMFLRRFVLWVLVMFFLDWALGALQANALLPRWSFVLFNFPFGLPFVWLEASWTGTHYLVAGRIFGEIGSMLAWFFAVLGQAALFAFLDGRLHSLRTSRRPA